MKAKATFRVVLQVPGTYARASGVVFSKMTAAQLALDYWDQATDGEWVCVFIPPEKRGDPDMKWVKGENETTEIYELLRSKK